jgi:hypothetical protein
MYLFKILLLAGTRQQPSWLGLCNSNITMLVNFTCNLHHGIKDLAMVQLDLKST